jgi:hypothetical protein
MSDEELKAELERLRRENAALKRGTSSGIRIKVSEKGAVSVYGRDLVQRAVAQAAGYASRNSCVYCSE